MNEAVTQRKLAEEIIVAVKSRLFDLSEFKINKIEAETPKYGDDTVYACIELPNGDTLSLRLWTKKAGAQ